MDTEILDDLKKHVVIVFEPYFSGDPEMPKPINYSKMRMSNLYLHYIGDLHFRIMKWRYGVGYCPHFKELKKMFPSIDCIKYDVGMFFTISKKGFALLKMFW